MLLLLLLVPLFGIFIISSRSFAIADLHSNEIKFIGLATTIISLLISLIVWVLFDLSSNQFQFVQECYGSSQYSIYLGVDGISIYFVLLTTIIMPIALLSNWASITENVKAYVILILLLETLLLAVFLVLDIFMFYVFFESILPPLFILIGLFGSMNRVRASLYFFLYTFIYYLNNQCLRAKFRGSPKALTTKDIRETFYLALLMSQGMVTSLKILAIKWVIADLSKY